MWFIQSGEWAYFVVPVLIVALIVMGFILPFHARDDEAIRVWLWIVTVILVLAIGYSVMAAVHCRRRVRTGSVDLPPPADYGATSPATESPLTEISLDSDE
jgi:hypothetical protein